MASVEEEFDFPRGGTVSKPTESKTAVQWTKVDNLFEVNTCYCQNTLLFLGKFFPFFLYFNGLSKMLSIISNPVFLFSFSQMNKQRLRRERMTQPKKVGRSSRSQRQIKTKKKVMG